MGLQGRTRDVLAAAAAAAASTATAAEGGEAAAEPLPAAFGKEEAEFLKALDDL